MYKINEHGGTGRGGRVTIAASRQNILRIQNVFINEHISEDIYVDFFLKCLTNPGKSKTFGSLSKATFCQISNPYTKPEAQNHLEETESTSIKKKEKKKIHPQRKTRHTPKNPTYKQKNHSTSFSPSFVFS